ncbi:hypothetical protein [Caulobacter sp. X]|uniref:hypothetical protein n=1 Tax=Caulobacter sp. X TaxID=2048901 RepID=UPI000C158A22|nr:hypothetical protein [Caulobacter sp. X]PIC00515.1 hypothetical protein CSW60_02825 [Caulobacter sp. X]
MTPTRRSLLATPLAAGVATSTAWAAQSAPSAAELLERYVAFGGKASGGPGDIACGEWMAAWLEARGLVVERQAFDAPFFEVDEAWLQVGDARAAVVPQAIVTPTGSDGIGGRVVVRAPEDAAAAADGAIVLIALPYARWSSAVSPAVRGPVQAALSAGAQAVVLITTGPSGEALALNADGRTPLFNSPVATLAPKDAPALIAAAKSGAAGVLKITGRGGRRPSFNLIGRRDRGHGQWLVVSTPRSGWFTCAGERGPGVAAWMMLADWASRSNLPVDLAFVSNSGHEYENLGAQHLLEAAAPPPDQTRLWFHLGANVAARDWHELGGRLAPLPSADPQRFLMASSELVPACRVAFSGLPGLEAPYALGAGTTGELAHIAAAGYRRVAGIFGAHRLHHAAIDDARCVEAKPVEAVFQAVRRLLEESC